MRTDILARPTSGRVRPPCTGAPPPSAMSRVPPLLQHLQQPAHARPLPPPFRGQVFDVYKPGSRVSRTKGAFPTVMCHVAISSGRPPNLQVIAGGCSGVMPAVECVWRPDAARGHPSGLGAM